jgi:hypothetical protein
MQIVNEKGNVETTFDVEGITGHLTVFYGLGCHNLVFYIEGESSSSGDSPGKS